MAVREIAPGEALGYGSRFVAERPTRVGLVAMGYADGYPRVVPDGTRWQWRAAQARSSAGCRWTCDDRPHRGARGRPGRPVLWGKRNDQPHRRPRARSATAAVQREAGAAGYADARRGRQGVGRGVRLRRAIERPAS